MANVEVILKKKYPYYGMEKKAGDKILVAPDQIPRLVRREIIEDPNPKEAVSKKAAKTGGK